MPDNQEKKINPFYPIAWCAFLLVPAFAFYQGWKHHSMLAMVVAGIAVLGFITLIWLAVRHNRKVAGKSGR